MGWCPTRDAIRLDEWLDETHFENRVERAARVRENIRMIENTLNRHRLTAIMRLIVGEHLFINYELCWKPYGKSGKNRIILRSWIGDNYLYDHTAKPLADCSIEERLLYGPYIMTLVEGILRAAKVALPR
jgi:hypothetical protein